MSFKLNDGSSFRIIDQNKNDITTKSNINTKGASLQIDVDKDGKFDGKSDINVTDEAQIKNILDKNSSNNESIKEIPFVDEIGRHMAKNESVNTLLDIASTKGKEAKDLSVWTDKDLKIATGKVAFNSAQAAFGVDKANPEAKFAYGMALLRIKTTTLAETYMGIKTDELLKPVIPELEKDKNDIPCQLLLRGIYKAQGNSNKANVEKNLAELKKNYPNEYAFAEEKFKKARDD
jgi:hypothetical protein